MPSVDITIQLDAEELMRLLENAVENDERFRPMKIVVENENAVFVEMGTSPANPAKKYHHGEISDARKRIREWYAKTYNPSIQNSDEEADKLYHFIMEHGLPPNSFFRAALNEFFETGEDLRFEDYGSTRKLAEAIAERMREIIQEKNIASNIAESIRVYEIDDINDVFGDNHNLMRDEVRRNEMLDSHGVDRSAEVKKR